MCPFFISDEKECGLLTCRVDRISCLNQKLCIKKSRYEICPAYILNLYMECDSDKVAQCSVPAV